MESTKLTIASAGVSTAAGTMLGKGGNQSTKRVTKKRVAARSKADGHEYHGLRGHLIVRTRP